LSADILCLIAGGGLERLHFRGSPFLGFNFLMSSNVLQLDSRDNVLVALSNLKRGEAVEFDGRVYQLQTDVPAKHKFATVDLAVGDRVVMYGGLVGKAMKPIAAGEVLTTGNIRHEASSFHEKSQQYGWKAPDISRWAQKTFQGYVRSDGQVGTRNYWIVVPLVFCENKNIQVLKQAFEEELGFAAPQVYRQQVAELAKLYREGKIEAVGNSNEKVEEAAPTRKRLFENVDGIRFLLHEGGCGGTREDAQNLCGLIAGYIHHPNVAGATVLSLGCQHAQIEILREEVKKRDPNFAKPLFILEQQKSGSEAAMMQDAIGQTFKGLMEANKARRSAAPLSKLCVGLKCGGSDGFSGISANPAIGHTSDLLAGLGARTILSEFPELCGVEQGLIDRGKNKEVGDRFIQLMRDYAARVAAVRSAFEMNPSPGNMRDGLLTDAMKSAGAAKKGGTSPVTAVLDYPEYSSEPGLNLQCTPGNDVECVTAQVGAGASVVLFTTGLGTPTGNPITPVVKLSTNSSLAKRMGDIIDVDTGSIIDGGTTIQQMGETILDYVVQVASGETQVKAEVKAQEDFIPWKRGVSL
jgi:altronate hydrolase